MKIGEFLSKCSKEQIPFYMYHGTGIGYKISCLECEFLEQNKQGIWKCNSMFYSECKNDYYNWLNSEMSIK